MRNTGPSLWLSVVVVAGALVACGKESSDAPSAAAASTMGPLEPSTNRQGRDISQSGVRTSTAAQCSDLCAADPNCRAMSFATSDGQGGLCFVKSGVPDPTENPAVTSAVKVAPTPAAP